MSGNNNPVWLKPLWRRVAIVVFCAAWASFELYNGSTGWAAVAGFMAAYGAWMYLYDWKDPEQPGDKPKEL